MFLKFLYRYYYTFFLLHKEDVDEGRIKDNAWASTLMQVSAGIGLLVMGIVFVVIHAFNLHEAFEAIEIVNNKFFFLFMVTVLPFTVLYYLLFSLFMVSKETGLTPKYQFEVQNSTTRIYWIFWIFSVSLPFVMAALKHGLV